MPSWPTPFDPQRSLGDPSGRAPTCRGKAWFIRSMRSAMGKELGIGAAEPSEQFSYVCERGVAARGLDLSGDFVGRAVLVVVPVNMQ